MTTEHLYSFVFGNGNPQVSEERQGEMMPQQTIKVADLLQQWQQLEDDRIKLINSNIDKVQETDAYKSLAEKQGQIAWLVCYRLMNVEGEQ